MNLLKALRGANALDVAKAIEGHAYLDRGAFVMELLSLRWKRLEALHTAALNALSEHQWGPEGPSTERAMACKKWPRCAKCERLRKADDVTYQRAQNAWKRYREHADAHLGIVKEQAENG